MSDTFVKRLADQLALHEGRRLKPYVDTVGKLTIGVGRNLTDRGISLSESNVLLHNDIDVVIHQLNEKLPWWKKMNRVRRLVLADMCFNLGIGRLLLFENTLAAMRRGDYELAATEMLSSKWAKQVGSRATRLSEMMRTGEEISN